MSRYYYWGGYTPSTPIEVEGGIKAKSKRGSIGDTWWSRQWVSVLESFGWSNRLERGRRYARKGQVLEFNLMPGKVRAKAQGSVPKPYSVTIEVDTFTDDEWDSAIEAMSKKAVFAAKLLTGEMPQDIEDAFNAAGVSLFPVSSRDIKTRCSCPDSANPCKHIAAVYYIIAEEFDRDPFMLFNLRGRTQDEITGALRRNRALNDESPGGPEKNSNADVKIKKTGDADADADDKSISDFWSGTKPGSFSVDISPPDVPAAIIKRLGTPEFWDSKDDFDEVMGNFYGKISRHAIESAYGELMESSEHDDAINKDLRAGEEQLRNVDVFQLKVTLNHAKPPIWRRILVTGDTTLSKLHRIIQVVMGWDDEHLHHFVIDGTIYDEPDPDGMFSGINEKTVKLGEVVSVEKTKFLYEYDFGDSWVHTILVENILSFDPDVYYPVCIKGKCACPPEDCGGIYGYYHILDVLEDPDDPDYEDVIASIGYFDPKDFSLDYVNGMLGLFSEDKQ
ncbi:MAG: IS1096 element passenger TnpR family protein [Methanosarcinaceae archaeon]